MVRCVVAILLNEESDTPGYMLTYLVKKGIDFVLFEFWKDNVMHMLPPSLDKPVHCVRVQNAPHCYAPVAATCREGEACRIRGVAAFGGSMSANDNLPYYKLIMSLMMSCINTRTPVIGHCLGGQLLSLCLGGTVQAAENIEVGWVNVEVENNGTDGIKDWFGGRKVINVFEIHTENFSIPPGARRIATNRNCANQAYQVGDQYALGMQFHPEVDEKKVRALTAPRFPSLHTAQELKDMTKEEAARVSPGAMTRDEIDECLRSNRIEQNRPIADSIYDTWCSGFLLADEVEENGWGLAQCKTGGV